jgi:hypothetical protein
LPQEAKPLALPRAIQQLPRLFVQHLRGHACRRNDRSVSLPKSPSSARTPGGRIPAPMPIELPKLLERHVLHVAVENCHVNSPGQGPGNGPVSRRGRRGVPTMAGRRTALDGGRIHRPSTGIDRK